MIRNKLLVLVNLYCGLMMYKITGGVALTHTHTISRGVVYKQDDNIEAVRLRDQSGLDRQVALGSRRT